MVKERRKNWPVLLLWPLSVAVLLLCRASPAFAEMVFARGIYRYYHTAVAFLTGLVPFSVAELLLYALVALFLLWLILWLVHIAQGKKVFLRGVYRLVCLAGVAFFLFVFGCGGNYYRATFADITGLTVTKSTEQELCDLCMELAQRTNEARLELAGCEDAGGVFALPYSVNELAAGARGAMTALGEEVPVLSGRYTSPKPVLWSRELSRFGITGIFMPFTVEANVNVDVPEYSIGAAMCHELGHMAGFMREDEANYIAYLACTRHGDATLRYSGLRLALSYASSALYKAAPMRYCEIYAQYSEAVRRDIAAEGAYWAQFEDTTASELGEKINDAYLKANNQTDGTKSYGAMVDLLLAEYKHSHS